MAERKTVLLVLVLFIFAGAMQLWPITLKVASQAPKNSDWDFALKEIAQKWSEISGGKVRLKIYSGSIAGDEDDMIRKMRLGQLDGAIISGIGLNKINPELILLSLPMFVQNSNELEYLLDKMGDDFEKLLQDEDYALIGWQIIGWVHFFAKKPVRSPSDLRAQKVSVTQGDLVLQNLWQTMGFQIIPSSLNEIMIGLQTGRIEAFYAPSILAASNQWFAQAPYMTDMPLSPLLAAMLLTEKSWQKIPAQYREEIREATHGIMLKIISKTKDLEATALGVMKDNGLNLVTLDKTQIADWNKLFLDSRSVLIGPAKAISTNLYDKAAEILNEYRSENN